MLKYFLFSALSFSCVIFCHAQKEDKIYFDSLNHKVLNPADAYYYQVVDSSKGEIKMKYYYLNGKLYAEGKAAWVHSPNINFLQPSGRWIYYYPNGNKKQIFESLPYLLDYSQRWYENGAKAFSGRNAYSFRFKERCYKTQSWYPSGQLECIGLQSLSSYGEYRRCYREDGTCREKRYYAEGDLPGISERIEINGNKKYYIILEEMFFWYDTSNTENIIRDTIAKLVYAPAQDGYNELIYDVDTFRFTIKNGKLEGAYYHSSGSEYSKGLCHRNHKTGLWIERSKGTRGNFLYHYDHYKRDFRNGKMKILWNDSMLLMKGRWKHNDRVGRWLILDGAMSDPRVMGDDDSLYFREEKFRHDTEHPYFQNVYAARASDISIKYLWIETRRYFLTKKTRYVEYCPNHQVKRRGIGDDKKGWRVEKLYDESGKFLAKKYIFYRREPLQ